MEKVKGIILAGGLGTRLYPLTKVTNKHLLPLGGEPMIHYPIKRLVSAGVRDIMIVTGIEHCGSIMTLLGSGQNYGCYFTYKVQEGPDGIAGALKLCEDFVGDSSCVVLLGDNVFKHDLRPHIESFLNTDSDCKLFFKAVEDPQRYGVGVFDGERLIEVEEKPPRPKTNLACIGVYLYSNAVFRVISKLKQSDRGEYEISSVNNVFISEGQTEYAVIEDIWVDAGTMDSYHKTNWLLYKEGHGEKE